MYEDEIERKTEEEMNKFLEKSPAIITEIMDILENSGLELHISYLILKKMVMGFEDAVPELKSARRDADRKYGIRDNTVTSLAEKLQNATHKRWNGGHKANIIIASPKKSSISPEDSKRVKCLECKKYCYYSTGDDSELTTKKPKIICAKCAVDPKRKYRKVLNKEQKEMLFMAYPELKTKDDETFFTFTKQ